MKKRLVIGDLRLGVENIKIYDFDIVHATAKIRFEIVF